MAKKKCTGADFRRIALSLDGTVEAPHFDRAAFKVARIFVTLAADGKSANFKFTPDEQEFKAIMQPDAFSAVPGGWGRMGYTTASWPNSARMIYARRWKWRTGMPCR